MPRSDRASRSLLGFGVVLAAALAVAAIPGAGRAGAVERVYDAGADSSFLRVSVFRSGPLARLAHDHTFQATTTSCEVRFDPSAPESGSVSLVVDATSLRLVDSEADEDDQAEIEETTRGEDVLAAEDYPEITFASTRVRLREQDGDTFALGVRGDLSLHGETREVSLRVTVSVSGSDLAAEGETSIDQSDFGIEPYSALLGAISVRDDVTIAFRMAGSARS